VEHDRRRRDAEPRQARGSRQAPVSSPGRTPPAAGPVSSTPTLSPSPSPTPSTVQAHAAIVGGLLDQPGAAAPAVLRLQGAYGNAYAERVVASARPAPDLVVRRVVTLKNKKGVPIKLKTPGRASADEVLDWVFDNIGERQRDDLAESRELLEAFCSKEDEVLVLTAEKDSWSSYKRFVAAFEIFKKSAPTKTTGGSQEVGAQEEDAPSFDIAQLGQLSELATATLNLEALLNPIVVELKNIKRKYKDKSQSKERSLAIAAAKSKAVQQVSGSLVKAMTELIGILESDRWEPTDLVHVVRFCSSFEFSILSGHGGEIEKLRSRIESLIGKLWGSSFGPEQTTIEERIHPHLVKVWDVPLKEFMRILSTEVTHASHGKSSVSAKANREQLDASLGELWLVLPMLDRLNQLGQACTKLITWDVAPIIVKILQGTTRRFKVATLCETMQGIFDLQVPLLTLMATGRVGANAAKSIRHHLDELLVEAVAGKSKEQLRQLGVLLQVLHDEPLLVCTDYEATIGSSAPIDMTFCTTGYTTPASVLVIEVEGLSKSNRANAFAYLKKRYEEKERTIGKFLSGQNLFLSVPVGTVIPADQLELIEKADLPIWQFGEPSASSESSGPSQSSGTLTLEPAVWQQCVVLIGDLRSLATKLITGRSMTAADKGAAEARRSIATFYVQRLDRYLKAVLSPEAYERFVIRLYHASTVLRGAYEHEWELENPQVPDPWDRLERDVEQLLRVLEEFMSTVRSTTGKASKASSTKHLG
jgi:hypothetical protein